MSVESSEALFLGRMPIFTKELQPYAYELLFVNAKNDHIQTPKGYRESAKIIASALNLKGLTQIIGDSTAFVAVDKDFLMHEMLFAIPHDKFVFEIYINASQDKDIIARIEDLQKQSYEFSISLDEDNFENPWADESCFAKVDYITVSMDTLNNLGRIKSIASLKNLNKKVIITSVETANDIKLFEDLDNVFFQGYFFAYSEVLETELQAPDVHQVIDLCNLMSADTNNKEISEAFNHSPDISMQLLQYINSSSFSFKEDIHSIEKLISLLGREKLKHWLLLTLYSNMSHNLALNPLLDLLDTRLEMFQEISTLMYPKATQEFKDKLNFLGLISLIDVILQQPLVQLVEKLHISSDIKEALLHQTNDLGEVYSFILALEKFDITQIQNFVKNYNIRPKDIETYMLQGVQNSAKN